MDFWKYLHGGRNQMVVQHNMQAANASRMLSFTAASQAKSTEKLSSGYKRKVQAIINKNYRYWHK